MLFVERDIFIEFIEDSLTSEKMAFPTYRRVRSHRSDIYRFFTRVSCIP